MKKILMFMLSLMVGITVLSGCGPRRPQPVTDEAVPAVQEEAQLIGEQKAQDIALENAGIVNANDVIFEKIDLDRDDGMWLYEVEFIKDGMEYSAEIKADDGTIISWEAEKKDR